MEEKNKNLFFLIIILCLVFCAAAYAQERLTITTYYPSPYGVYKTLRLFPDVIALDSVCTAEGEMEYSSSEHKLLVCTNTMPTLKWQLAVAATVPPGTLCGACIVSTPIACQGINVCTGSCPAGWNKLGLSIPVIGGVGLQFCVKQ